jgi:CRISPR-associated protein Cmr1
MKKITFECRLLTPYFVAGADGIQPEFRPSAIKASLRFWWRALNGHLSLLELKRKEVEIFGGGGESASKSSVIVRCTHPEFLATDLHLYKRQGKKITQKGFVANQSLEVTLGLSSRVGQNFDIDKLQAIFELACLLGGIGKRSRRGRGSIAITRFKQNDDKGWSDYSAPEKLQDILTKITLITEWYQEENNMLVFKYPGKTELYPFAQQIQVGNSNKDILGKIDQTTHELLQKHQVKYKASMGHVNRRFASPVYTSAITNSKGDLIPIITTLKNVPDQNHGASVSGLVVDEFKNRIL